MSEKTKIKEGDKVDLEKTATGPGSDVPDKDELEKDIAKNLETMKELQEILYAESRRSLLIVLQAMDAGGKDGTIRKVFGPLNPQGCRVVPFKVPTEEEKAHDFLWRVHRETPRNGMIGIFNRSHYEDVLIVRVHGWIDEKECARRIEHIRHFEKLLADSGVVILKFYLHISKDEQKKRLQKRLDNKRKNWKFNTGDLGERKLWNDYMRQFEQVIEKTSTAKAPWHVIPADSKKYRDWLISGIVRETLEKMELRFPEAQEGLDQVVIE